MFTNIHKNHKNRISEIWEGVSIPLLFSREGEKSDFVTVQNIFYLSDVPTEL